MWKFVLALAILFLVSLAPVSAQDGQNSASARVEIPVPFVMQAVTGQWTFPWEDFCEEASTVMAYSYVKGIEMRPLVAALQMLRLAEWENHTFDHDKDTGVEDTERMLNEFYGVTSTRIVENPTVDSIKAEVRKGNLVIVPVAGKLLHNPYFVDGPRYHMLIVRGYDDTTNDFIVNEPGTIHGDGFRYSYATIMNAMHDLVPGNILEGPKRALVISK